MKKKIYSNSWQKVAPWYNKITEGGGHYYHQHVVIPGVLDLLNLKPDSKLLDLACGNGVLGKSIPKGVNYVGVDIAPSLISEAKKTDRNPKHEYFVGNATKPLPLRSLGEGGPNAFTHATIILAIQNIENPQKAFWIASQHLVKDGTFVIVLNHPAFRIPRQSSWGIDERTKMQYRRVDRYLNPMVIPIKTNPSDPNSPNTLSYHHSLSDYSKMLKDTDFVIELIEEWTSDRESVGRAGKMENRAREEFPLFMAIKAVKH